MVEYNSKKEAVQFSQSAWQIPAQKLQSPGVVNHSIDKCDTNLTEVLS